jgi:SAM-dependent methyltransferase
MTNTNEERDRKLAAATYEVAHPRPSVVAAIASLGLRPGLSVLDAGCGPGVHLGLLLDAVSPGGHVVGLDLDPHTIEVAAALWPEHVRSGALHLSAGDVTKLPFDDGAFAVAWASLMLHHVADPVGGLRELGRVVGSGGLVAVLDADVAGSFPFLPWPPALEERVRAAVRRGAAENYGGKLEGPYHPYFGRDLPRAMREAGLRSVDVRALADVDRAPLAPPRETELRVWFRDWVDGRLHDYLAPVDRDAVLALVDPAHPDYLLGRSDFFLCRTWLLATGHVA